MHRAKSLDHDLDIDFVLPWVDGSDSAWLAEKAQYMGAAFDVEDSTARYRDWGLLHYWFRGVEEYAPWVHKIHFITWGHVPNWLNIDHPKLNIVRHEDYIPSKYLPTFSSHTIELNIHRIEGLSENFVYFNDDMFLIRNVSKSDFFKRGLPRLSAIATPLRVLYDDWFFVPLVNIAVINRHFDFHRVFKKNLRKWINPAYGINVLRTLGMLPYPSFYGFLENHLPSPLTKTVFQEVWSQEAALLDDACSRHIRSNISVNQWLMKYWLMASGKFEPANSSYGKAFQLYENWRDTLAELEKYISRGRGSTICINDSHLLEDFDVCIGSCQRIMKNLLPEKSSFEL